VNLIYFRLKKKRNAVVLIGWSVAWLAGWLVGWLGLPYLFRVVEGIYGVKMRFRRGFGWSADFTILTRSIVGCVVYKLSLSRVYSTPVQEKLFLRQK